MPDLTSSELSARHAGSKIHSKDIFTLVDDAFIDRTVLLVLMLSTSPTIAPPDKTLRSSDNTFMLMGSTET